MTAQASQTTLHLSRSPASMPVQFSLGIGFSSLKLLYNLLVFFQRADPDQTAFWQLLEYRQPLVFCFFRTDVAGYMDKDMIASASVTFLT